MPRHLRRVSPVAFVAAAAGLAACAGESTPPRVQNASACQATDTGSRLSMAVGDVRVLGGNALDCVRVAGGDAGAQFVAIVGNTSTELNRRGEYQLKVDYPSLAAVAMGDVATPVSAARLLGDVTAPPRLHDVHERLMAASRELDLAGARASWAEQRSAARAPGIRGAIFPSGISPQVGTTAQIRVPGLDAGDRPCSDFSTITATVQYISNRSIIMVDNASPANGFSAADLQAIGTEFDNLIYPTDIAYFGSGSDIDANSRIVILYTPEVNKATPRGSSSLLAGFFWAGDLFPRTGSNSCSQSNQSELFYLLVPDPTGTFSSARSVAEVREKTRGTIAHEFQHMLNAGWRLENAPAFEDVWLDEALAHFAEEAVGRAKLGVGDFEELTHSRIADTGNNLRDYNAFFFQNLARYREWLARPGVAAAIDSTADTSLAVRGASWALLRYAMDHHAGTDARAFTRRIANSTAAGVTNLRAAIGTSVPMDTVLTGWQTAAYADNLGVPVPARFTFRSWNMRDAVASANQGGGGLYPLAVATIGADATVSANVRSGGGANYYRLAAPAGRVTALQVAGTGGTVGFPGAKLILVRTQ